MVPAPLSYQPRLPSQTTSSTSTLSIPLGRKHFMSPALYVIKTVYTRTDGQIETSWSIVQSRDRNMTVSREMFPSRIASYPQALARRLARAQAVVSRMIKCSFVP